MTARRFAFAIVLSCAAATAALAADDTVKPAATPAPSAGPTIAAANAFCGEPSGKADALIAKYSSDSKLKKIHNSDLYVAFADDDKNPSVVYTLTTSRNPAHPAAVCRKMVKEGDQSVMKMEIVCNGAEGPCSDLRNEFNVMAARMQVEIDRRISEGKK